MTNAKTEHWQNVYRTKSAQAVSWFRPHLEISLDLIKQAGVNAASRIIDVGAGASTLVDDLLDLGVKQITEFDISDAALEVAKQRLGSRAADVQWIVGDAVRYRFRPNSFDIWHDRAVLHFLVDPNDAAGYVANATVSITNGGYAVIGCFASDGPEMCSGLPVVRREAQDIAKLFGKPFALIAERRELHLTPSQKPQSFAYALLRKQES